MNHLSDQEFDSLLEEGNPILSQHINGCHECSTRLRAWQSIDLSLRRVSVVQPSLHFTVGVMKRLRVVEPVSLGWTLMKNLAPICALSIVVGIMLLGMKSGGAFESAPGGEAVRLAREWNAEMSRLLIAGIEFSTSWVNKYFSFASHSFGLLLAIGIFFGAVGLLDKFILTPLLRRRTNTSS